MQATFICSEPISLNSFYWQESISWQLQEERQAMFISHIKYAHTVIRKIIRQSKIPWFHWNLNDDVMHFYVSKNLNRQREISNSSLRWRIIPFMFILTLIVSIHLNERPISQSCARVTERCGYLFSIISEWCTFDICLRKGWRPRN